MKNGVTYIIFGITGDLAKRKLIPALYHLSRSSIGKILIIGVAIEEVTSLSILKNAQPFVEDFDAGEWDNFCNNFYYERLDVKDPNGWALFKKRVIELEKKVVFEGKRLVYLATASSLFGIITQELAQIGLIEKKAEVDSNWHRVIYEKPFGHDAASAHKINVLIARYLNEHQIFRIDHYLTKELVSNISIVRFTNCVFEPLWNNRYIDQINILLDETIDIEGRGQYYDQYGALRDVLQNHILQMLALIAMESPSCLTGDAIRDRRVSLLKSVEFSDGIRGQYKDFIREKHVADNSKTETFAALLFQVKTARWLGVPFFVKTGKCLQKREVAIQVKFKQVDCLLARNCALLESNWLTFSIAPEEQFSLKLNVKMAGESDMVTQVSMRFCHQDHFDMRSSQAYETLLKEVVAGEQASAVRFDEIEAAWAIIDQIEKKKLPLYEYERGSAGPVELKDFIYKHGIKLKS